MTQTKNNVIYLAFKNKDQIPGMQQFNVLPSPAIRDKVIGWIWLCTVLICKPLRWLLGVFCFIQFLKIWYYWGDGIISRIESVGAFLLIFGILAALTYFVSIFKPSKF